MAAMALEARALLRGGALAPEGPCARSSAGAPLASALSPEAARFTQEGALLRATRHSALAGRARAAVAEGRELPQAMDLRAGLRALAALCVAASGVRLPRDMEAEFLRLGVPAPLWRRWREECEVMAACGGRPSAAVGEEAELAYWSLEAAAAGRPGYLPGEADPRAAVRLTAQQLRRLAQDASGGARVLNASKDGGRYMTVGIEADGRDWIVDLPEGESLHVTLDGGMAGGLFLVGRGFGYAVRTGPGSGTVGRYGGPGNAERAGEGAGWAYHVGHAEGLPWHGRRPLNAGLAVSAGSGKVPPPTEGGQVFSVPEPWSTAFGPAVGAPAPGGAARRSPRPPASP